MNEHNHHGAGGAARALAVAVLAALIAIFALWRPIDVNITAAPGGGDGNGGAAVGLNVSGVGIAHVVPDIAYANIGVTGFGETVNAARSEAAAAADRVLTALRAAGIDEADIQTTNLSLYPHYPPNPCPYPYYDQPLNPDQPMPEPTPATEPGDSGGGTDGGRPGRGEEVMPPQDGIDRPIICLDELNPQPSGWNYDQSFEITIRDIDAAGEILDEATRAGVTQISGIRFDVEDREAVATQARAEAIEQARERAEAMAEAAGAELGAILSISESSSGGPIYYDRGVAGDASGGESTPVAPGSMDVTVTVNMTFALDE